MDRSWREAYTRIQKVNVLFKMFEVECRADYTVATNVVLDGAAKTRADRKAKRNGFRAVNYKPFRLSYRGEVSQGPFRPPMFYPRETRFATIEELEAQAAEFIKDAQTRIENLDKELLVD